MGRSLRSIIQVVIVGFIAIGVLGSAFILKPDLWPTLSPVASATATGPSGKSDPTLPVNAEAVELVRVVDGDTIIIRFPGQRDEERLRMIGIDTPETKKADTPVQCFGPEATQFTTTLLTGKRIWIERDVSDRDQYGRLLRYVWVEDGDSYLLANERIVALGYAIARDYPPDTRYHDRLMTALANARNQQFGMWGVCERAATGTVVPGAPSWWTGGDLDCADFAIQKDAQAFFEAMGGPEQDPHHLDLDGDGVVCVRLP